MFPRPLFRPYRQKFTPSCGGSVENLKRPASNKDNWRRWCNGALLGFDLEQSHQTKPDISYARVTRQSRTVLRAREGDEKRRTQARFLACYDGRKSRVRSITDGFVKTRATGALRGVLNFKLIEGLAEREETDWIYFSRLRLDR